MANLVSPGVQVSVTDESVYGPAGSGTVPMLFIATGENKVDPTGTETDGIAKHTKKANAGKPVLVTSQRELTQFFGNVDFHQTGGSVVQGDETNEYGLLAAYSFLGQSSAAYVVRGDIDLGALRPLATAPAGPVASGTYWLNPTTSNWGIFEFDGNEWVAKTPTVELTSGGAPTATVVDGGYLVAVANGASDTEVEYYVGNGGAWVAVTATFAPHYSAPASPASGAVWVKTTTPGGGISIDVQLYTTDNGSFVTQKPYYAQSAAPTGVVGDTFQDGTGAVSRNLVDGDIWLDLQASSFKIKRWDDIQSDWDAVSTDPSVATGGYTMSVATTEPSGAPVDGTLWFDPSVNDLAIFEVALEGGVQKWVRATSVQYTASAPLTNSVGGSLAAGDYWIDTDADGYPVIYRHSGSTWVLKDNTDQSTSAGVEFGDITDLDVVAGGSVDPDSVLLGGPDPLLYPVGMTAINMCRSASTVRVYDSSLTTAWKWRNEAPTQANGAGSFGRLAQRAVVTAALQASASGTELREETVTFRLIAAPGYPEMMDEMVTLNSDRNETAFVIVDSPLRLAPSDSVAWVQGANATENGETGLVSRNTYAATYYPSVLTTDPSSGLSVVAPASHSVLYTYAYNDNVSFQWFAPAGLTRGQVQNASNVGYINSEDEFVAVAVNQGTRDAMYLNSLNPIARFAADGIVVYGQKTLHAGASALDRVNVARLTAYLRERFAVIGRPYLFEPNDKNTRDNAKGTFDGFMANILTQRGVYDFAVVCDTTNNTPARIDANELYIDVAIEPTKAAEFIYIPIRILNTGELG